MKARKASVTRGRAPAVAPDARAREPQVMATTGSFFAVAAPGLAGVVADELRTRPGVVIEAQSAEGVSFQAPLSAGLACNLHLRCATRLLLRLGTVDARDFATLRRRLARLPWAAFLRPGQPVRAEISVRHCRLYHSGGIRDRLLGAIADGLGAAAPVGAPEHQRVFVRGEDDRFTVSIDTSGALLHQRGYRTEAGEAPLRETLAAGLLALCEHRAGEPLVDPMCGSGTIAIEAALRAAGRPPGSRRRFAFDDWPDPGGTLARLRKDEAKTSALAVPQLVHASDADEHMVKTARANAERAGLFAITGLELRLSATRLADLVPPAPAGLLLVNPPYGKRLADRRALVRVLRELGKALAGPFAGWRAGVLAGQADAARIMGLVPTRTSPLRNGGLPVWLFYFAPRSASERTMSPASSER